MSERCDSRAIEWCLFAEEIKYHYLIANEPLNIIRDILKRKYGFYPSENVYKKKFKEWKWRKSHGKGELSVPEVPTLPEDLARPDIIFRATHIYITDSFALDIWSCNDFGDYQRRDGKDSARSFEELKRTLHLASEIQGICRQSHERGQFLSQYTTPLLSYSFHLLRGVATEHHPLTLIQILALADMLINDHNNNILYGLLIALAYWTRQAGLTELHPLRVILRQLADLINPNRKERLNAINIRVCLKEFCKAVINCFINAPTPCQKGINPFLVEVSHQTGRA
ncbi:hypothetical protein Plec18167_007273 [Paecilomyces lecythidis]|uniref:Clr5 domain-containing protein n=1 Tax=Paecilomyces lecythidis TaxID=3004212 RepID=A0ABR3X4T9_9EURO